jgi:hypothetical protein
MRNLQRFTSIGDTSGAGMIWTCCVICLAHLAALCHLISQTDPTSSISMEDLYDQTLDNLCNLSLEVHVEGYPRSDILTGVRVSQRFAPPKEMRRLSGYSTQLDVLENGVGHHRCTSSVALGGGERIVATLENDHRKFVRQFSSENPGARTGLVHFPGYVDRWSFGGFKISKSDKTQGKGALWTLMQGETTFLTGILYIV